MSSTSLRFDFLKGRNTASPEMRKISRDVGVMALAVKAASVASVAGTLVLGAGMASLAAEAVALVAAVTPAVGAIALLPSVLVAGGAGFAAMKLATGGLGDALKQTAGGGASAGAAIAAAEKRIATAQREAAAAALAVNDAREAEAERLDDLTRSLARARLDEESATMAVADAERNLRAARRSGDRNERAKADLAYRESLQTLDEVRDRLEDVSQEEAKSSAAGVEGSDAVKSALQHQADAVEALKEAQDALKKAQSGGGGVDKAAEAYAKLAPAGKALVDVLRQLGPAWLSVRQAVQQSVFAGVAGDLKALSGTYLPMMRAQLPAIGAGWNAAFRDTAALATSAGFVADTNSVLANTATFWQRIGHAAAPFLSGFRQFAVVGARFLPGIGDSVARIANRFEAWATAARESGRAHMWMANSLVVLGQLWNIAKNLGSAIVSIFRAGDAGPGWLAGLEAGTAALSAWLASPAGQGKMAEVFAALRDIGSQLWDAITRLGPALLDLTSAAGPLSDTISVGSVVMGFLADNIDVLAKALPAVIAGFILWKTVQSVHYVAQIASLPVTIAQVVANWRLASAMKANTAAMSANIGLTRMLAGAQATSNVAMTAGGVATQGASVGTRALGFAMKALPIIGWISLIIELVMWIVDLWNTNESFRKFVIGAWQAILDFFKGVGHWFANDFVNFFVSAWNWIKDAFWTAFIWIFSKVDAVVKFFMGLPGRVGAAVAGLWDGLTTSFRHAINYLIRLWNEFHLTLGGGSILGMNIPSITLNTPDIPYLEAGGTIARGGAAIVADRNGQGGEVVSLPRGAQVTPLSRVGDGDGGSLRIDSAGNRADEAMLWLLRKAIRERGGNVQAVLGRG